MNPRASRLRTASRLLLVLAALYVAASLRYYTSQRHYFDPFTQMPLSRLSGRIAPAEPGMFRILALGGSTTECGDLPESLRYPEVVSQLLAASEPSWRYEVFNAGRDWLTSRHSLIAFTTYYQDWRPDLVVILEGINDLYRSFSPEPFAFGDYDPLYSHFYGASAEGAMPPSFEQHLYRRWAGPLPGRRWYEAPFGRDREVDYPLERYRSIASYESNLVKLVRAVRNGGAEPVLVTQASLYSPEPPIEIRKVLWFGRAFCSARVGFARYESPTPASLARALAAFNRAMRSVAAAERVTLVDADAALEKSLAIFQDDVHYTTEGARRLAVEVANGIRRANLVQREAAGR